MMTITIYILYYNFTIVKNKHIFYDCEIMLGGFTMQTFGERLKMALEEAGYTRNQAAEKLELSQSSLSNYILKNRIPDATILLNISELLGVSMEWLLTGDVSRKYLSAIPLDKPEKNSSLISDEKELLSLYRQLSERNQLKVLGMIEMKISEEEAKITHQATLSTSHATDNKAPLLA